MKKKRLETILELIDSYAIGTQEELLQRLRERGLEVTQATVSRDIKELRIVKTMDSFGQYRYAVSDKSESDRLSEKFRSIFEHSVRSADYAGNTLVIHCYTGMAQAACAAFDSMRWEGLVGTLAGDDTVFALCRTEELAAKMKKTINEITGKGVN